MNPSPSYAYRAARSDGAIERGVLGAQSRDAAAALLGERGLFPIDVELRDDDASRRPSMPPAELALGMRMLADLLAAGLPIGRALAALAEIAPPAWSGIVPSLQESVRTGQSIAAALDAAPVELPSLAIGIVRAGEGGSGLAAAVRRAADLMEERASTRAAVRSALAYPLVLTVAGVASVVLLVGVVLPKFAVILADLGQSLPATTRIVLRAALVARVSVIPLAVLAVIVFVIWRQWTSSEEGRRAWHARLLALPGLGAARLAAASANACAALAALLESGVPIAVALAHAARATGDAEMTARLLAARETVTHGARLSRAAGQSLALTPTAVRLVRAGEETGDLAAMLVHAARIDRDRVSQLTRSAVRLIEPALVIGFGAIIAVIAAALLQAIYGVRPGR